MKHKIFVFLALFFGVAMFPATIHAQVVVEKSTEIITIGSKQYYMHHVKKGETLYSIARVYEVSEEEINRLNPEIQELGLQADMVIGIPVVLTTQPEEPIVVQETVLEEGDEYGDGYIVHTVKEAERTRHLLRRWGVDEEAFRKLNPTVGSHVFVGQKVLIPYENAVAQQKPDTVQNTVVVQLDESLGDSLTVEVPVQGAFVMPKERPEECYASADNRNRQYHVVLMVPLYLNDIEKLDASKEKAEKTKNTRALKFLQFYEGFMMAADSLTTNDGLRLDLTVIDVHENIATAQNAVNQINNKPVDLIIGPFFSKSFSVVQEYAANHEIMIVNPMSERENIVVNAPNVVKLKPSANAMADALSKLIRSNYPKAKVGLVYEDELSDDPMVKSLEQALDSAVNPEVFLSNAEMLELITRESLRRKMGKRILSTLEVEGQVFSSRALGENPDGEVYFDNPFRHYGFSDIEEYKKDLSAARENVLVAYGNTVVFSTTILNNIHKSTQKFPITLIGLPRWDNFDNLLVPNLLNLNAIYFDDHFVDFNDSVALKFVDDFRLKYESEPMEYAFEGFDVGWYFLNALMEFGPHPMACLPYYHIPLLHTRYYFGKSRYEDGLQNQYLNVYQFDGQEVVLKPIGLYQEDENE